MKTLLFLVMAMAALAGFAAAQSQSTIEQQAMALDHDLASRLPPFRSPAAMQAEFVRRFEMSPGFGLSRVVRPVFLAPTPHLTWNGVTYRITPPELIALEDDPVAYAPREHGHRLYVNGDTNATRREIRKHFKHRELTALETNAVRALREGRDLVVLANRAALPESDFVHLPTTPALFVMGALRASESCVKCHQCEPNALLGAFAYNLSPLPPTLDVPTNSPASRSNLIAWTHTFHARQ